jgi:dihydroorotate dehydrogenase (fumarate)
MDMIKEMQKSGAGAMAYRSLFQEQIELEKLQMKEESEQYDNRHPMMIDVFPNMKHAGPREHLLRLEKEGRWQVLEPWEYV